MNKRTRTLAFAALGLAGLLVAGFATRAILLRPLRALDDQIVQLQIKLQSLDGERKSYLAADTQIRSLAGTLFGARAADAEAQLGALLTAQLLQAGLHESDFTRIPAGRRRLPGAEEVGWTVQGEGPHARLVDFLFLLQNHPRLHRLESLAFSPANEPGRLRLRFRYLTLVLTPAPEVPAATKLAAATLDSPARRRYDAILRRDLLRPFEPEPPSPPGSGSGSGAPSDAPPPTSSPGPSLRLVSLSSWGAPAEAHLLDLSQHTTRTVRPGDPLLDGLVAAIDDRPLPAAGKPGLLSYRRLILRLGNDYWAVETGQNLDDRRRLNPEDLPPSLLHPASTNTPPSP